VNCWLLPFAIDTLAGVTDIDVSTGAVTVNEADLLIKPDVAITLALPWATAVAKPPMLTVTVAFEEEVQLTVLVKFWVVPFV
jgi:hypothetical protein